MGLGLGPIPPLAVGREARPNHSSAAGRVPHHRGGRSAVFIQNRRGIRRFTSELLEVATGRGMLVLRGEGMVLGAREIGLAGRIQGDGGLRAAHGPRRRAAVPGPLERRGRRAAGTKDRNICGKPDPHGSVFSCRGPSRPAFRM